MRGRSLLQRRENNTKKRNVDELRQDSKLISPLSSAI